VVEFVAVVPLLFLVGLAVLQVGLYAHAKSLVDTAATEAARVAAVSADPVRAARATAQEILGEALIGVPIVGMQVSREYASGLPVVAVQLQARADLYLLPGDPLLSGRGRALIETQP
jgi:Flp pilus assembly protein TadG